VLNSTACSECFEPTLAAYGDAIVAATGSGTAIDVSLDDGATWTPHASPAYAPYPTRALDQLVAFGPGGELWMVAVVLPAPGYDVSPLASSETMGGVGIAQAPDANATWTAARVLGFPSNVQSVDRPWITFDAGPRGPVYVTWKQTECMDGGCLGIAPAKQVLEIVTSSDAADFSKPVEIVSTAGGSLIGGKPLVVGGGALLVPYLLQPPSGQSALKLARSTDGGHSFQAETVWQGATGAGAWFPAIAADPNGTLFLAWVGPSGDVLFASSSDNGATWTTPIIVAGLEHHNAASPWISARSGAVDIAALEFIGDKVSLDFVHLANGSDPTEIVTVASFTSSGSRPANTDFVALDETMSQRLLAWSATRASGVVSVARIDTNTTST
jgi:hypothetical protein